MFHKIKKFLLKILYIVTSDMYRGWIYLKEILYKNEPIDVAYITNFQNETEKGFMGSIPLLRNNFFSYSLKLRTKNGKVGRIITINSLSKELIRDFKTRELNNKSHIARVQIREAIDDVTKKGAKVILFGASTKRLFTKDELIELNQKYAQVIFTIGDNGTVIKLWEDVNFVIKENNLSKNDKIVIIGPNGFLGSSIRKKLEENGFNNLFFVSQSDEIPFDGLENIKLIVACSHHPRVKLKKEILNKIKCKDEIFVIDVSLPYNFSEKEYTNCIKDNMNVVRIDAGNSYNKNLDYDGRFIATIALKQIGLSRKRLFGCFSEATALADFSYEELIKYDFLNVDSKTIKFVEKAFNKTGFEVSYPRNFGKKLILENKKK